MLIRAVFIFDLLYLQREGESVQTLVCCRYKGEKKMDEVTHTILPNTAGGGWGGTALGAGFGGLIGSWLGNGGFGRSCFCNCQRYEKIKKNPQQKLRVKTIKDCMCFVTFTKVDLNSYGSFYFIKYFSTRSSRLFLSRNNLISVSNF